MKAKISIHSGGWKGPFFTIWSGQAVSLLGSSLAGFAIPVVYNIEARNQDGPLRDNQGVKIHA